MAEIFFAVIRLLVNQAEKSASSKNLVFNIWLFIALIIASCFSAGILRSMLDHEHKPINTVEELLKTNMTAITVNDSWIYWQYEMETKWNVSLDANLEGIKSKLRFVTQSEIRDKVCFLNFLSLYYIVFLNIRKYIKRCPIKRQ